MKQFIMNFAKNHKKETIILFALALSIMISIILILLILIPKNNEKVDGLVKFDDQSISVFQDEKHARQNLLEVEHTIKYLNINTKKRVSVTAKGLYISPIIKNVGGNNFEVDLSKIESDSTVIVVIKIGGDGSFVGRMLNEGIETYYLALDLDQKTN